MIIMTSDKSFADLLNELKEKNDRETNVWQQMYEKERCDRERMCEETQRRGKVNDKLIQQLEGRNKILKETLDMYADVEVKMKREMEEMRRKNEKLEKQNKIYAHFHELNKSYILKSIQIENDLQKLHEEKDEKRMPLITETLFQTEIDTKAEAKKNETRAEKGGEKMAAKVGAKGFLRQKLEENGNRFSSTCQATDNDANLPEGGLLRRALVTVAVRDKETIGNQINGNLMFQLHKGLSGPISYLKANFNERPSRMNFEGMQRNTFTPIYNNVLNNVLPESHLLKRKRGRPRKRPPSPIESIRLSQGRKKMAKGVKASTPEKEEGPKDMGDPLALMSALNRDIIAKTLVYVNDSEKQWWMSNRAVTFAKLVYYVKEGAKVLALVDHNTQFAAQLMEVVTLALMVGPKGYVIALTDQLDLEKKVREHDPHLLESNRLIVIYEFEEEKRRTGYPRRDPLKGYDIALIPSKTSVSSLVKHLKAECIVLSFNENIFLKK